MKTHPPNSGGFPPKEPSKTRGFRHPAPLNWGGDSAPLNLGCMGLQGGYSLQGQSSGRGSAVLFSLVLFVGHYCREKGSLRRASRHLPLWPSWPHRSPQTPKQLPVVQMALQTEKNYFRITVRVKIITGSLVTLENLFPENYRYRYRLEIRMNYHYRYRLGPSSRPFFSIDSQLPSRKSFELIFWKLPLPSWNVFELER